MKKIFIAAIVIMIVIPLLGAQIVPVVKAQEVSSITKPTLQPTATAAGANQVVETAGPASYPCTKDNLTIAEHMRVCTGHEAPYTQFEIKLVYDTNSGTVESPNWGFCSPGSLGCVAANQGIWSRQLNDNGAYYMDWSGFYFIPTDICATSNPMSCYVYWPIQTPKDP